MKNKHPSSARGNKEIYKSFYILGCCGTSWNPKLQQQMNDHLTRET
ncbi:hypothetical protein AAZX31_20G064600 [Glycine max]